MDSEEAARSLRFNLGGTIADHLYLDSAQPRPIELAQVHRLPAPENEGATLDGDPNRRSDQTGQGMPAGVALVVLKTPLVAEQISVGGQQIRDDVRVGILVDRDGGGGVRRVDQADAVADLRRADERLHACRHVDKVAVCVGLDGESSQHDVRIVRLVNRL